MADPDTHFYEPKNGHGLKHDPFNAIVGPRPIGWVSTKGRDGNVNLAPYSFFNAFNYTPPILGFSSIGDKNSLRNVRETGEFVWNLTTRAVAERMNRTCAMLPYGQSEFTFADLAEAPSRLVAPPRVRESPVNFECKVTEIIELKSHTGAAAGSWLVPGEAVAIHIDKKLLVDGVFDTSTPGLFCVAAGRRPMR